MKTKLKVKAISIDSLEVGSKVYLELEDGTRVWAGGKITKISDVIDSEDEK